MVDLGFTCDQNDLVDYFHLYKDLMDFWHQMFPEKIYDLCYEDLTTNQEDETRKLLEFCDLDWDENCLDFASNARPIQTNSTLQVRKKMYTGSSEAWKDFKPFLKTLIKGLNS